MKRFLFLLALLLAPGLAHANGYVDLVLGGDQGNAVTTDFRNANFVMHIGCIEDANGQALPGLAGLKYEYCKPTDYARLKWLRDLTGETWTNVPGTNYADLSVPANRAAIVRAEKKWCDQIGTTRIHIDCIMEVAPGQQMYAADLVDEFVAAGFKVMINNGDPYTARETDVTTPWGRINKAAAVIFIQVGVDLTDQRYTLSRFAVTVSDINYYVSVNKSVIAGIFDLDGKQSALAQSFFGSTTFDNPLVYKHYNVSYSPAVNVGLQIPGGKPVNLAEPTLGLLAPLSGTNADPIYMPADNWWNVDISSAPIDPSSAQIITDIYHYESTGGRLHPDFTPNYGIPYAVVGNETPLVVVNLGNTSESDRGYPGNPIGYPIPAAATTNLRYIENSGGTDGDRHLLVYHRDLNAAFELSYVNYANGQWSAGYGAVFKLDSNYRRPEGWTSTDAAGLCVLAGLVKYDELYGAYPIRHATRVSIKKVNGYVWPASHTGSTDSGGYPCGMRFRLKANVDTSKYPAPLKKLFDSWKTYGLIVADRGGNMYIQGTMDSRWDNAILNPAFHALHVTDFEVIKRGWGQP